MPSRSACESAPVALSSPTDSRTAPGRHSCAIVTAHVRRRPPQATVPHPLRREPDVGDPEELLAVGQGAAALGVRPTRRRRGARPVRPRRRRPDRQASPGRPAPRRGPRRHPGVHRLPQGDLAPDLVQRATQPRDPPTHRRRGHLPRPRLDHPPRRRRPGTATGRGRRPVPLPRPHWGLVASLAAAAVLVLAGVSFAWEGRSGRALEPVPANPPPTLAASTASAVLQQWIDALPAGAPPATPYWHDGILHVNGAQIQAPDKPAKIEVAGSTVLVSGRESAGAPS